MPKKELCVNKNRPQDMEESFWSCQAPARQ